MLMPMILILMPMILIFTYETFIAGITIYKGIIKCKCLIKENWFGLNLHRMVCMDFYLFLLLHFDGFLDVFVFSLLFALFGSNQF